MWPSRSREAPTREPSPKHRLQGRRILLVENACITAFDLKADLESLGAQVLGQVPDPDGAPEILAQGPGPEAALRDINQRGGEIVFPSVGQQRERHIRFIHTTGYDG